MAENTLSLTDGGSVDLSGYLDNTDTQDLSLSDNTLSLTDGGSVDLSGYLDDTDTTYTAGTGLTLIDTEFSVDLGPTTIRVAIHSRIKTGEIYKWNNSK